MHALSRAPCSTQVCVGPSTHHGLQPLAAPRAAAAPQRSCRQAHAVRLRAAAAKADAAAAAASSNKAAALIKACVAKPNSVPAPALLSAMLELEAAKLPTDGWQELLEAPGTRWRLIFTADAKAVKAAMKQQPNKGGVFFPLTAVQKFEGTGDAACFTNGVFLGPVAHLTFDGPYAMAGRQLTFDVSNMNIGLGPLKLSIPLKKEPTPLAQRDAAARKALPFFLYSYIDEDIVVGRGRGGGLAVWARTDKAWEARAGVLQVYK